MDLMGMMGKLKETQQKNGRNKETIGFSSCRRTSTDGLLKITITANRTIKSITIDDALLEDKEQLRDWF
jgi:DNA-binding protein YbaB